MRSHSNDGYYRKAILNLADKLSQTRGNILVYIVMIMVIFGLLGALMVSLFSTSISSSAAQNDVRRAYNHYESGIRYAASEMVNSTPNFSSTAIDRLNTPTYKITADESFKLRVFGLDIQSISEINTLSNNQNVNLKLNKGLFPGNFTIPITDTYVVNFNAEDLRDLSIGNPVSPITGFNKVDNTHIDLSTDDFIVAEKEPVALAVLPYDPTDIVNEGENLRVTPNAALFFPRKNGAIIANGKPYFYDSRIDKTDLNYVELTNIRSDPKIDAPFPLTFPASSTYVILSPAVHIITSEGKSGEVTYTEEWYNQYGGSIYDRQDALMLSPESLQPDIEFTREDFLTSAVGGSTTTGYITADNVNKSILITGSYGFGSVWFRDTRPIGGIRDYCQDGGCFFKRGFRAFFILKYSGADGDGLTFSVINEANNDVGSVGGDVQLSELLAYAGDSRIVASPSKPGDFLDGKGEGLEAPKLAVEFDGKRNNQNQTICRDATTVNTGSRFDPDFSGEDRDTVQYVFWGKDGEIDAECRNNQFTGTNKTYDDNRHDAVTKKWEYSSGSRSLSSPVVFINPSDSSDVGIITGRSSEQTQQDQGQLIRLRPSDGKPDRPGWKTNPDTTSNNDDDIDSTAALDDSGRIYIGSDRGILYKYNASGSEIWSTPLDGSNVEGKPVVSNTKQRVYVVTDPSLSLPARLHCLNTDTGAVQWFFDIGNAPGDHTSSPAVRHDLNEDKNYIYVGSRDKSFYVVRDDGGTATLVKKYDTAGEIRSSPVIHRTTGDVYFGSDDSRVHAVTKDGVRKWVFATGGIVVSSPEITLDGTKLYVGSNDGHLYALDTQTGNPIWKYPSSGQIGAVRSSPALASDGTIYFGSDDGRLYALNPDGTLRWQYPPAGASRLDNIVCKPAVGPDGIVYFTTEDAADGKLYALDPAFNIPPNIPNYYLTPAQLDPANAGSYSNNWLTTADAPNGWAVRVEVERSLDTNAAGKYEYTLKSWMKKCQDAGCSKDLNDVIIVGGFFQNTRFEYDWTNAGIIPLTQTIELDSDFHGKFERFLFGFTSASTATQTIEIGKFQLSFIRPNDSVVHD